MLISILSGLVYVRGAFLPFFKKVSLYGFYYFFKYNVKYKLCIIFKRAQIILNV